MAAGEGDVPVICMTRGCAGTSSASSAWRPNFALDPGRTPMSLPATPQSQLVRALRPATETTNETTACCATWPANAVNGERRLARLHSGRARLPLSRSREAVAQTPGEDAGSFLRVGSRIGDHIRHGLCVR